MIDLTPSRKIIAAWNDAVAAGKLQNFLVAPAEDTKGRWRQGDRIRFGLRVAMEVADAPEFFAVNESLGREISLATRRQVLSEIGFECRFSEYRLLKPGGNLRRLGRLPDISDAADQCRFHCENPAHALSLLNREPLATARFNGGRWNAYYNALPLEPCGHFIWVPTTANDAMSFSAPGVLPHFPQRLTAEWVDDLLELSANYCDQIVLFNSLYAGASVNHIHLQSLVQRGRLAVETSTVTTYCGLQVLDDYPAAAFAFAPDERAAICNCVARLQELEVPFNLVCFPARLLIFPRDANHAIVSEFPGDALAGLDFAGRCFVADPEAYEAADANRVISALGKTVLSMPQLEKMGYFRQRGPQ